MSVSVFSPRAIVVVLDRHHVDYVVIGGFAANVHGAVRPTTDIDVAPATTTLNLTRLADALRELKAGIRVDEMPEGLPFETDAEALRGMQMLNLRSEFGDIDLTFSPAGFPGGYADLIGQAGEHVVDGLTIRVAALQDVITSKATANRPKDREALPELIRLARQAQRGQDPKPLGTLTPTTRARTVDQRPPFSERMRKVTDQMTHYPDKQPVDPVNNASAEDEIDEQRQCRTERGHHL